MSNSETCLVVVRHLEGHRPAVLTVLTKQSIPTVYDHEIKKDMENRANSIIEKFKVDFPEFESAKFYLQFIDIEENDD